MRIRRGGDSERGQVLVMFAASLTALLGFSALVVDIGMMWNAQQVHRGIADAAVLAGAQEQQIYGLRGINAASREEARYVAMTQIRDRIGAASMPTCAAGGSPTSDLDNDGKLGYPADIHNCPFPGTDFSASVLAPSPICANCDPERSMMVEVQSTVPTILAGLFGRDGWNVRKTSVAAITYNADFAVLTLRPPVENPTTNEADVGINGGSRLHVSIGDIGTNTNVVLTGGGSTISIDEGYKIHHWDAVPHPSWTGMAPAKKLVNLIEDPNHAYPSTSGAPVYSTEAAGTHRMSAADCATERQKVPVEYTVGATPVRDLDSSLVDCLKPGVYNFAVKRLSNTKAFVLTPGVYFFNQGLVNRGTVIGGYEAGLPGVALVFNETVAGRLDANNALTFALNAGGAFGGGGGAEAAPARAANGVPVQTGGDTNLAVTLMVTKDPNCVPVLPYPSACNDNGNSALNMAGGGSLYLAGVQYAPTDNVTFTGGSAGDGQAGRIVAWTVKYSGGTTMTQQYPGEREGNGILRLDAACTGAGPLSMSNALCNP